MWSSPTNVSKRLLSSKSVQVAAIFSDESEASEAANALSADSNAVSRNQITLLTPGETRLTASLEADSRSTGKRLLNSHVAMGAIGLLIGFITAYILVLAGPLLTQQNPVFTFIALISPGLFIGMFVAGLFSLRPDRTNLIETVRHALKQQRFALVVSLSDAKSIENVKQVLLKYTPTITQALQ